MIYMKVKYVFFVLKKKSKCIYLMNIISCVNVLSLRTSNVYFETSYIHFQEFNLFLSSKESFCLYLPWNDNFNGIQWYLLASEYTLNYILFMLCEQPLPFTVHISCIIFAYVPEVCGLRSTFINCLDLFSYKDANPIEHIQTNSLHITGMEKRMKCLPVQQLTLGYSQSVYHSSTLV